MIDWPDKNVFTGATHCVLRGALAATVLWGCSSSGPRRGVEGLSSYPSLEWGSGGRNDSLQYDLIGFEDKNSRFWVVVPGDMVGTPKRFQKIVVDLYDRYGAEHSLQGSCWSASFFTSREAAGYQMFHPREYLAEYGSAQCKHQSNQLTILPALKSNETFSLEGDLDIAAN